MFVLNQVLGPLISSLPKPDSNGDEGSLVSPTGASTATGGMNVGGLSVTPVLALGPNGTQQHILQVFDLKHLFMSCGLTNEYNQNLQKR